MIIKKLTYQIITLLGVLLMTTGCSDLEPIIDDINAGAGEEYNLRLILDASGQQDSRAPEEGYVPGVGYENYLEISGGDYRVAVFTAEDEWLFNVMPEDLTIAPVTVGDVTSKKYVLDFMVKADAANKINDAGSLKIVILANWRGQYPNLGAGSRLDQLFSQAREIAYNDLPVGDLTSADDRIPMYGVTQFDDVTLRSDGYINQLGRIHLLRALAKVEVLDDRYTSLHITSVKLNRHAKSASPMPKNVTHQDHYVKNSYSGDYVQYPSYPATWDKAEIIDNPVPLKKDVNGAWSVYLPEFDNTSSDLDDTEHIRLEISFEGLEVPDIIDFKYYTNAPNEDMQDKYFDVLRNNIYRFTVKKNAHGVIYPVVDIIPYSSVVLEPEFGLERDPVNGWMIFRNEAGYLLCYYDEETHTFYDRDYQKITFKTHAQHPSWLEVVDAHNEFAWYVDVENGRMYDINGNERLDLNRHQTTGWVAMPLSDGGVDYYLDPIGIILYDRNRKEVEMETPEATGAYKYLRDDHGHRMVYFDAIRNKTYDANGNELKINNDNQGRAILTCPDDGSIYCLYDRNTATFYAENGAKIKNPFSNSGWEPFRYTNGSLICYYDATTGKFYDMDLEEITFDVDPSHPWLRVVDHDGNFMWNFNYENGRLYDDAGKEMIMIERDRTTGNVIRRNSAGEIVYYINPIAIKVYDVNQSLVRLVREGSADESGATVYRTNDLKHFTTVPGAYGGPATYYFDAASGKLYDKNKAEISLSSLEHDPKGRVIIKNDAGQAFRYYDVSTGKFYTIEGIPVSNPLVEHTFDDVLTEDGKFVCFYYQDDNRFTDGYGRTISWELVTSDSHNPWFKVVDSAGNFFWYVDLFTMELYNASGTKIDEPVFYKGSKKITSGKIDSRTGRIEYLYTGAASEYASTAYWLDPVSLVMYDRKMREVILPHENDATGSKQIFRVNNKICYTFDVLNRQIYKNGSSVDMYGKISGEDYYFWFRYADNSSYPYAYRVKDGVFYKINNNSTIGGICSNPDNPFLDQL